MRQETGVFIRCGDITAADIVAQAKKIPDLRIGVKAIFFDPTTGNQPEVLLGRLPEGYPIRFNFPGGGVDENEDLATALLREVFEEFGEFDLAIKQLQQSLVVDRGRLPFPRDGYKGKYEYLVAVPFAGLRTLVPKVDSKIVLLPPLSCSAAARLVWEDVRVDLDQRNLYSRALDAVSRVARLGA